MAFDVHPNESDLWIPLPGDGESWDPWTIHTHYFGFSIPEAQLGAFLYVRYQPAFPLCQGGVIIFRGTDNTQLLDMAFVDYQMTMPWPKIDGHTIETDNGLRIEFLEPGKSARITYLSADQSVSVDVQADAVTPLLARGHVMPGEEDHHDPAREPGGSEQFMHMTGSLKLRDETFAVDSFAPRDRSWRQVRKETQGGARPVPPVGWSPMYFGEDLIFNQISFEHEDTDPAWKGLFTVPPEAPTHHFAWVVENGEAHQISKVRRNVLEYHPQLYCAMRQEIEAESENGKTYRFSGEAIAAACMPAWPNTTFRDTVYRWEDEQGRVAHATYQEIFADHYTRAMHERAALRA